MRIPWLAIAWLCGACGSPANVSEQNDESTCDTGLRIHAEALSDALAAAPSCLVDDDCAVFEDTASCPGSVEISLCDLSVHRAVVKHFDQRAVNDAMCDATAGSTLGCTISATCAAHGAPVCKAGECVFAPASP